MKKPTSPPSRQKKNRKKVVAVTSQEIPRSGPQRAAAGKGTSLLQSLAHLSLPKVKKILRARAEQLLAEAASIDLELDKHIVLSESQLSCSTENFWVRITQVSGTLKIESSTGTESCREVAALLAFVLEEKTTLGLAAPPPEDQRQLEHLDDAELAEFAIAERRRRALEEPLSLSSADRSTPWTDYAVANASTGKTYRVALRSLGTGDSYCSCPDFRDAGLGTCKHLLYVQDRACKLFRKRALDIPYRRSRHVLTVRYNGQPSLHLVAADEAPAAERQRLAPFLGTPLDERAAELAELIQSGPAIHLHPDAAALLQRRLFLGRIDSLCTAIRRNPGAHPLRQELLKVELRPYQLDGIAFCVGRGRAILADDMGLGKTIQAIGVAELLAREAQISRVLIVTLTSVKSQWLAEIGKFSHRSAEIVLGSAAERPAAYRSDSFFTIVNYEQVQKDLLHIENAPWDLIILDEAQRIKNWESKTARVIKALRSPFALALTGTPLENRLEELHSIASFVDPHQLGPAFRFLHRHRVVTDTGKVLGYKNLEQLRQRLSEFMLRRTRALVLKELPSRSTEVIRLKPTAEQADFDAAQKRIISGIVTKKFISEMDLLRLQKALLLARMNADSTFLVDKETHYSSKLPALAELLSRLADEGRKIVIFSEWTTMLDLIEETALPRGSRYVRLDGSVPQKKRAQLVTQFQDDPKTRIFLTSNAGSTGLNLQAADTVVNVDLPWNPAVLEQRIARAHRMGQKKPVQVYLLVTEETIEEQILGTIAAKKELFSQALEADADLDEVSLSSGIDELKRRLETLLAPPPVAPVDESQRQEVEEELARQSRSRLAAGQMLGASLHFLGSLAPHPAEPALTQAVQKQLEASSSIDADGGITLNLKLADASALQALAQNLAAIMAGLGKT